MSLFQMKPMNVEYLMMDASILLPPTGTPLTGIDFVKRLPCGDVEKTRRVSERRWDPPLLGCRLPGPPPGPGGRVFQQVRSPPSTPCLDSRWMGAPLAPCRQDRLLKGTCPLLTQG